MKYVLATVFGFVAGFLLAAVAVLMNPLFGPLEDGIADESLLLTHAGRGPRAIFHADTGYGWLVNRPISEADMRAGTVRYTAASALLMNNAGGSPVAVAIRLSALRDDSHPLVGELLEDNVWHVIVPGRGSFAAMTTDNLWPFVTSVALPALRNGDDRWRGTFSSLTTVGPRGQGRVLGLGGAFAGLDGDAVSSVSLREFDAVAGPVEMVGKLALKFD
jgi:hypothetical protein